MLDVANLVQPFEMFFEFFHPSFVKPQDAQILNIAKVE